MISKHFLLASFILAATVLATKHANAQAFPTKQITLIVPASSGGAIERGIQTE